ncbi:MAG: thioredoxin family protein [Patescibacteria group bacterium]
MSENQSVPGRKIFLRNLGAIVGLALFSIVLVKSKFFCTQAAAFCGAGHTRSTSSVQIAPQYSTFSQSKLAESLAQGQTVVLYFYAPWCSTCTSFDQELKAQNHQLPDNVTILQVDYDSSSALKNQYNVLYQHTLVLLDKDGQVKEMWIGGDLTALLQYLKKNS